MRKHNLNKSLSLSTQTVRALVDADLTGAAVAGGVTYYTCPGQCVRPTLQANAICDTKK
jgi:hypothetical protein